MARAGPEIGHKASDECYFLEQLETDMFYDNAMGHDFVGTRSFYEVGRSSAIDDFVFEAIKHVLSLEHSGGELLWGRGTACGGKSVKEDADVLETLVQVVVSGALEVEVLGVHS